MQLGKENPKLNDHYQSQSVAEQNSVDVAWELLMQKEYKDLRQCIYGDSAQDMKRFRQIVVAVVLATDIFDKKLKTARDGRWAAAFSEDLSAEKNRDVRATIVIEHLIQVCRRLGLTNVRFSSSLVILTAYHLLYCTSGLRCVSHNAALACVPKME